MTQNSFVVAGPDSERGSVEAWSTKRLPLEPNGWRKELRTDIRQAVRVLTGRLGQTLYATYVSRDVSDFDVENVLFYNVGLSCFRGFTGDRARFERGFAEPPSPPQPLDGQQLHYQRYTFHDGSEDFQYWRRGRTIAEWDARCGVLRPSPKATEVWHWLKNGNRNAASQQERSWLGIRAIVDYPKTEPLWPLEIMKPLFDGVIAAFHSHDGTKLEEVSVRLADQLGIGGEEAASLLMDESAVVLGRRRLLWPWRDAVQWNPGDDRLVVGEIIVQRVTGNDCMLSGELFEVTSLAL